jgi:hypothetical protein
MESMDGCKSNLLCNICTFLLFFALSGITVNAADRTGVYFYAANDRPVIEDQAVKKIEVRHSTEKRIWLHTYLRDVNNWKPLKSELVRIKSPEEHIVFLYIGTLRQNKTIRTFEKLGNNHYWFEEVRDGVKVRSGQTRYKYPIHLEGLVTEYHENGQKSTEAYYQDNQLVWNHNWLANGKKYIDTIFYSVDTWPQYIEGDLAMKAYMNNYIVSSRYYSKELSGTVLLGFVIMEDGELAGVHQVNKPMSEITEVVKESLQTLPGSWKPAVLDDKFVRCYMTFPVNFKVRDDLQFENVQIIGNMMFYNYR